MAFKFPKLPYDYDALHPHFDKRTMTIHHTKHHAGYTNKLNAAIKGTALEKQNIETILSKVSKHSTAVRNNGGGYYNHSLFWKILSPKGGGAPKQKSKFGEAFYKSFKSYEAFQEEFSKAAATRFGSGWAWLCVGSRGKLFVTSTPNQDNPLMDVAEKKGRPILGLDVWEHAYYLKYQNKRPDYIGAFFNLINWNQVSKNYTAALSPVKKIIKKTAVKKVIAKKAATKPAAPKKTVTKKAVAKKRATPVKRTSKPAAKKVIAKRRVVKKAAPMALPKNMVINDSLVRIEGIGPKIEKLLQKSGINTFDKLAKAKVDDLKSILSKGGNKFQMHEPKTWPKQAKLAATGKWDKLKVWQKKLKGGK